MSELVWKTIEPELCDVIAGGTPSTDNKEFWDGDVLWITPSDMSRCQGVYISDSDRKITDKGIKYATGKLLPAGSVVISCRAPVGYCCLPDKTFTTNQGCKTLICKGVDAGYLYYYLLNSTDKLIRVSSGTTFLELSKKELSRFSVYLPKDKNEQHKIAEVLMALDEVIDRTREIIEKYRNVKKGLMYDTIAPFSENDYAELNTVADLFNGDRSKNYPSADELVEEGYAFVNAGHLQSGRVNKELCDYITKDKFYSLRGAKIKQGDILYCLRGTLGKNAFIDDNMEGTVASSLVVIRAKAINSKFLYYILNSFIEEKQRIAADNGTAQPNLSAKSVAAYKILIPDSDKQLEILEYWESLDRKIEVEEDILRKYQSTKLGLLQDLLSGRVDVTPLM